MLGANGGCGILIAALQGPASHHTQVLCPANVGPKHHAWLVHASESGFQYTCAGGIFLERRVP